MIVHCSTEGWSTSDGCWMGSECLTFFAGVINKWPLIHWLRKTLSFFALRNKLYWKTKTKENADIFVDHLCDNAIFKSSMFFLKTSWSHTITQKSLKEDKRSVSILPTLSKIFEMIMFAQISAFFDYAFLKYQCGFWKGYSTQDCKLKMLRKMEKICR